MSVTLFLPAVLAKHAPRSAIEGSGATVGAVVDDAISQAPALGDKLRNADGTPYPFVTIYLNDEDIRFQAGFDTPVNDGDEVTVVPAIAGG